MRGDSGVAGEGRVVGIPKFHSWVKCTMPLTNINSIRCQTLPLACVLFIAERLSTRLLIVQCSQLAFVYMYVYPSHFNCVGAVSVVSSPDY